MKKLLLMALLAVATVALVAAPGWAGKASPLSDTELAAVYGGDGVDFDDFIFGDDNTTGDIALAGANHDAAIAQAQADADNAVQVAATCESCTTALSVQDDSQREVNAVNLNNTVASNNALQTNALGIANGAVTASTVTQANVAYSSTGNVN